MSRVLFLSIVLGFVLLGLGHTALLAFDVALMFACIYSLRKPDPMMRRTKYKTVYTPQLFLKAHCKKVAK